MMNDRQAVVQLFAKERINDMRISLTWQENKDLER